MTETRRLEESRQERRIRLHLFNGSGLYGWWHLLRCATIAPQGLLYWLFMDVMVPLPHTSLIWTKNTSQPDRLLDCWPGVFLQPTRKSPVWPVGWMTPVVGCITKVSEAQDDPSNLHTHRLVSCFSLKHDLWWIRVYLHKVPGTEKASEGTETANANSASLNTGLFSPVQRISVDRCAHVLVVKVQLLQGQSFYVESS